MLQAMPGPLPFERIRLINIGLTDAGMTAVADGLGVGRLPRLRELRVQSNAIGDAGFVALAKCLPPTGITTLRMYHNKCGDAGMIAMMQALAGSATMEKLGFGSNAVGAAGFEAVAAAVPGWPELRMLWAEGNPGMSRPEPPKKGKKDKKAKAKKKKAVEPEPEPEGGVGADALGRALAAALPSLRQAKALNLRETGMGEAVQEELRVAKQLVYTTPGGADVALYL